MKNWKTNSAVFMTAIASGTILNPLNSSMIALALHSIQRDYRLDFATVSWLVSGFYLVSAVGQPATGKLGDIIGRKKLFLTGLIIAAIASVFAPLAPVFIILLLMRFLQAAGSSAVYPSGVALVHHHVSKEKQASALAVLAICASVMTAFGPTVGGFLIVWGGWQSIFYVNFPFILVSLVLGALVIPADKKQQGRQLKELLRKLDLLGIGLFTLSIVSLLWFLLEFESHREWLILMIGLVAAGLLILRETKVNEPFIDLPLLHSNHKLSLVYLLFIFMNIANYCLFYGMPAFFQSGLHLSVRLSGAMMLFMSIASVIASLLSGHWVDRSGVSRPIRMGALLTLIGSLLMLLIAYQHSLVGISLFLLLMGGGYGVSNVALQASMLQLTPEKMVGTGSGLFQTCRYIGSIASSAILGVLFRRTISESNFFNLIVVVSCVSLAALLLILVYFRRANDSGRKAA